MSSGVVGIVTVSKSRVKVGEPVHISFTLTNTRGTTQVFETRQYPVVDIKVIDGGNQGRGEFWRWSRDGEPTQGLRRLELKPGESKTIEGIWIPDAGADDKRVRVVGVLTYERLDLPVDPRPGGGSTTAYVEVGRPSRGAR